MTRRCSERRFFLRPDRFVEQVFGYLLAVASKIYKVDVHCAIVLSNHYHAVVTDREGRLPQFLAWLHRLVAVVVNNHRGRWEALWNSSKPSVVRLETPEDVLDKMVYVYANAVAAGLVERPGDWPGFLTTPEECVADDQRVFERPERFFDQAGRVPEEAQLDICRPPGLEHYDDDALVAELRRRLDGRQRELAAAHEAAGTRYLGPRRVLRIPWHQSPNTPAPRRVRSPHVASKDEAVRRRALQRLKNFRRAYRTALVAWRDGDHTATFPAGTYGMRVWFAAPCHDPP